MKRRRCVWLLVLALMVVGCSVPAPRESSQLDPQANYWRQLGSTVGSGRNASLVTDGSSNTIAFSEFDGSVFVSIRVKKWNGTTWTSLGLLSGSSATDSYASNPSLALDTSGNPVVAWSEWDGSTNNIYVQRFNGVSWINLGTGMLSAADSNANNPSLALDSAGNPTVAWFEHDGSTLISMSSNLMAIAG